MFDRTGFPTRIHPISYLAVALLSQTGMSFVQQGLVVAGTFFAISYHLTLGQMGLITSALSFGLMCSYALSGVLADRVGPRRLLAVGASVMAVVSLTLTVVRTYDLLLLNLFLLGAALAVAPSSGTKAIFSAFAGRPRGLVMGIRQTGVPLGAALSAWLLPVIVPRIGLSGTYITFAAELLATGWLFSLVMPSQPERSASSQHHRLELKHWRTLSRPVLVSFLMVAGQYILLTYTIVDLHTMHHLSLLWSGLILAFSQVTGGAARIVLGQWSDAIGGRRPPMLALAALVATGSAATVAFLPSNASIGVCLLVWGLFGIGSIGWNALALTWSGESVPPSHSGLAIGINGSVVFLGSALFAPLFGFVVDATHRFADGWLMLAFILLVAAVLSSFAALSSRTASNRTEQFE